MRAEPGTFFGSGVRAMHCSAGGTVMLQFSGADEIPEVTDS